MEEKTLNIGRSGRSAKEIFEFVRKTLDESEVSFDGRVSQAYDGASVMPGARGGLQALVCSFCGRSVIYILCFCHIIHLVVISVIRSIEEIKDHFGTVSALYDIFKLTSVKRVAVVKCVDISAHLCVNI